MNGDHIAVAIEALSELGEVFTLGEGDVLYQQGEQNTDLFLLMTGSASMVAVDEALQTRQSLQTFVPGQLIGLTAHQETHRPASVLITESARLCRLDRATRTQLAEGSHPASRHLVTLLQHTLLTQSALLMQSPAQPDVLHSPVVDALVQRSVIAQRSLLSLPEEQLDELIGEVADAVNRQAWELAEAAINETGMGLVSHRVQKILLGTMEVAASLKGQPGSGELLLESPNVDAMRVPMGVVLGLIPVTNPVETLVFKTLISLKSRNALIVSCNRRALQVGARTVRLIRDVLARFEVNPDVLQMPDLPPTRQLTSLLMSHQDVSFILATGGDRMVRSAYRSGTPSIGVGKGNAPVWVCDDADLAQVSEQIVASKSFDNGVVCGSENNLIISEGRKDDFVVALEQSGAAVLNPSETLRLMNHMFADGVLNERWLGKSAQHICQAAGIKRSSSIELIVVPHAFGQWHSPLVREKLAPIVSLISVETDTQALTAARQILSLEGQGHTAIIHSRDQQKIDAYAQVVNVCRVLVNSPGTQGCIGACNGLALSWTLGCGTAGGSSTSDNVTYRHLQNTKRIAHASMLPHEVQRSA